MVTPHPRNACSGTFDDWLEVHMTPDCNGSCPWCVEARGFHPRKRAPWPALVEAALGTGRQSIILLGGEPTLHRDLAAIICALREAGRDVYVTTNGSMLTVDYAFRGLRGVSGVNISIHSADMAENEGITGVLLLPGVLRRSIDMLHSQGAKVRINCNLIAGTIDSIAKIREFVAFAKDIGADSVRFAELKFDDRFVDASEIMGCGFGLNRDPMLYGCNTDTMLGGMPVNFRQMCGFQTPFRSAHEVERMKAKPVLYYDGNLYPGWQCAGSLSDSARRQVLDDVADGRMGAQRAAFLLTGDTTP